ncbi:hypothetical protein AXF42_Ash006101 [Apostasia shenzhenica]|uniref:Uncharacterized protein n=1 Tax=Apostasia shenzhenica TaxID=1088818 RepID=A0A2I0B0A6_9ASPA|nr:hypothetical protein AXF42_Ash006101 [Apostasia shenzhenica]
MERRANIKAKGKATTAGGSSSSCEDDEVSSETKSDARSSRCDRDDWEGEDEAFSEEGVRRKMGVLARMVGMEGCGQPAAVLTEVVRVLKELDGRARGVCSSGKS